MEDHFLNLMFEYDDLLLKRGKTAEDVERIECIEVLVIEQFGPCDGMKFLQACQ